MDSYRHGCLARGWAADLRHPVFVTAALVYTVLYINKHWLHRWLPLGIASYLGDLLSLPLLLSLALAAHRLLIDRAGTLPVTWVVGAWLVVAIWFEGLLPRWSAQAMADPLDVLAYALGALAFHHWLNRPPAPGYVAKRQNVPSGNFRWLASCR
jgi:hypothetical protein